MPIISHDRFENSSSTILFLFRATDTWVIKKSNEGTCMNPWFCPQRLTDNCWSWAHFFLPGISKFYFFSNKHSVSTIPYHTRLFVETIFADGLTNLQHISHGRYSPKNDNLVIILQLRYDPPNLWLYTTSCASIQNMYRNNSRLGLWYYSKICTLSF